MTLSPIRKMNKKLCLQKLDIVALVLIFISFCFAIVSVQYCIGHNDESFYYTIVQRVLQGDRLLVDEWHVSQFSSFLLTIPYVTAVSITGGTDGIIIILRTMYFCWRFILAIWFWSKIRRFGFVGIICEMVYFSFPDLNLPAFSYASLSLDFTLIICCFLFLSKESFFTDCLCGVFFGLLVLAEPFSICIFFFYSILVFANLIVKRIFSIKELPDLLKIKKWGHIFLGCCIVAAVFFLFLLHNSTLDEILKSIPELFDDSEFDLLGRYTDTEQFRLFEKLHAQIVSVGTINIVLTSCIAIIAFVLRTFFYKRYTKIIKYAFVLTAVVLFTIVNIRLIHYYHGEPDKLLFFYGTPLLLFSGVFCCLNDRNTNVPACFFLMGLLVSICVDSASEVRCSFGGVIAQIGGTISCYYILYEMMSDLNEFLLYFVPADLSEKIGLFGLCKRLKYLVFQYKPKLSRKKELNYIGKERKMHKKHASIYAGVWGAVMFFVLLFSVCGIAAWTGNFILSNSICPRIEWARTESSSREPLNAIISVGPQKGIKTTKMVKTVFENTIFDIDTICEDIGDTSLYIYSRNPALYLHANVKYSCYAAWYVDEDFGRQIRYWHLHPDRIPGYVYIPYHTFHNFMPEDADVLEERLNKIQSLFDCKIIKGRGGYILKILDQ